MFGIGKKLDDALKEVSSSKEEVEGVIPQVAVRSKQDIVNWLEGKGEITPEDFDNLKKYVQETHGRSVKDAARVKEVHFMKETLELITSDHKRVSLDYITDYGRRGISWSGDEDIPPALRRFVESTHDELEEELAKLEGREPVYKFRKLQVEEGG